MLRRAHLFSVAACFAAALIGATAHALTTPQLLRLDTGRTDQGHAVATAAVGNVYVAASISGDSQRAEFVVIKYDSRGLRAWTARYSGSVSGQIGRALAVTADSSGNVYATGSVMTVVGGVTRGTDLRVPALPTVSKVAINSAGEVFAAGGLFQTLHFDAAGNVIGQHAFVGQSRDVVTDMSLSSVGDLYVTGTAFTSTLSATAEVGRVAANARSFVDGGVSRSTQYRYRVRAFNDSGNSAYSNVVSLRTSRR